MEPISPEYESSGHSQTFLLHERLMEMGFFVGGGVHINEMALQAYNTATTSGFPTPVDMKDRNAILAKLMLIVTEVAEAAEEVRQTESEKAALGEELADILIRVGHLAYGLQIDLEYAVTEKMIYNAHREYRHGKGA